MQSQQSIGDGKSAAVSREARISLAGRAAARLDRLPLTWVQWRLALITQIFWGVIIAADGIPAKLYPFVWGPRHSFGTGALSVMLAVQFGVGILIGEYLIGMVADRWGRRTALLLSSLAVALPLWPTASTDAFWPLLTFFGLSSIGMGGVLAVNVVYMGEIVPPQGTRAGDAGVPGPRGDGVRTAWQCAWNSMGAGALQLVHLSVCHRSHCRAGAAGAVGDAGIATLAGSAWPARRSGESHGARWKRSACAAAAWNACPSLIMARYAVPVNEHVPLGELFRGEYGERTIVLLIAWIIGYAGLVYGFSGYLPVLLASFGFSAGTTFGALLVASVAGGGLGLAISALIGEAVERRTSIVASAVLFCVAMFLLYFNHGVAAVYVLSAIAWGTMTVWLFNMYNYTASSYPTRLRATGVGLTDGLGHLGSIFGPLIAGWLFATTAYAGHAGWYVYVTVPGALLPAALIGWWGINQRRAILEQIST